MGGACPPQTPPPPFSETYACLSVARSRPIDSVCVTMSRSSFLEEGGSCVFVSGVFFFFFFKAFPSSVNRQLSVSSSVSTCPPSICGAPAFMCSALGLLLAGSLKGAVGSCPLQELQGVPLGAEPSSCSGHAPVLLSHIYKHQISDVTRFRGRLMMLMRTGLFFSFFLLLSRAIVAHALVHLVPIRCAATVRSRGSSGQASVKRCDTLTRHSSIC